jgi:hypothetical protein
MVDFDLYPDETPTTIGDVNGLDLYTSATTGSEIDLRDEFHKFLYGGGREIAKGQRGILRKMNRDTDGKLVSCPCVSELTGESDRDSPCPYCFGEGFLWVEQWVVYYKEVVGRRERKAKNWSMEIPGNINVQMAYFYLEYGVIPSLYDKIIEVDRDEDGVVLNPIDRIKKFSIGVVEPLRSDNGRVEYFRVAAVEDVKLATWEK